MCSFKYSGHTEEKEPSHKIKELSKFFSGVNPEFGANMGAKPSATHRAPFKITFTISLF